MKPIICVLLFILGIGFVINAKPFYVTHNVYVRAGAGTSYKPIGIVNKGETVEVVEITGSWAKITHNKQYGFISAKFLSQVNTNRNNDQGGPNYIPALVIIILIIVGVRYVLIKILSFLGFEPKKRYTNNHLPRKPIFGSNTNNNYQIDKLNASEAAEKDRNAFWKKYNEDQDFDANWKKNDTR